MQDFFFKSRYNFALTTLLASPQCREFQVRIEDSLAKQMLYFAKIEKVNQIVGVLKAVRTLEEEDQDLLANVRRYWVPLLAILDEEDVFSFLFWAGEQGGQAALDKLKVPDKFSLHDPSVIKTLRNRVAELESIVDATTQDWVARTVAQGMRDGLSHVEIAKLIRDGARKQAQARADVISENETANALEEISYEVYRRNEIGYHTWVTQRDEMTCDICMANEATGQVRIGEVFPNGVLYPPAHINCRCFDLPVIPDNFKASWTG